MKERKGKDGVNNTLLIYRLQNSLAFGDIGLMLSHSPVQVYGEGNGNPFQYCCLENSMDKGAWWATVHGVVRVGHDLATKQQQKGR